MYTFRPRLDEFQHFEDLDGADIATFTPCECGSDHTDEPLFDVTFADGTHGKAFIDEIEGA